MSFIMRIYQRIVEIFHAHSTSMENDSLWSDSIRARKSRDYWVTKFYEKCEYTEAVLREIHGIRELFQNSEVKVNTLLQAHGWRCWSDFESCKHTHLIGHLDHLERLAQETFLTRSAGLMMHYCDNHRHTSYDQVISDVPMTVNNMDCILDMIQLRLPRVYSNAQLYAKEMRVYGDKETPNA